jgi:hypothetical protein
MPLFLADLCLTPNCVLLENILEIFRQAIVGTLTTTFKNQPKDQLATKIPISGSFQKADVHIWPTFCDAAAKHLYSRARAASWSVRIENKFRRDRCNCNLQFVFPEVCALQFRIWLKFVHLPGFPAFAGISRCGTPVAKKVVQVWFDVR